MVAARWTMAPIILAAVAAVAPAAEPDRHLRAGRLASDDPIDPVAKVRPLLIAPVIMIIRTLITIIPLFRLSVPV